MSDYSYNSTSGSASMRLISSIARRVSRCQLPRRRTMDTSSKRKAEECVTEVDCGDLTRMSKAVRCVGGDDDAIVEKFEECDVGESRVLRSDDSCCSEESGSLRASDNRLQFFIKLISGNSVVVRASGWDTVWEVMLKVQRRSNVPVYDQRLIFHGKQLDNESLLNQCGIRNNDTLAMLPRMKSSECSTMWQEVGDIKHFMRRIVERKLDKKYFKTLRFWIADLLFEMLACGADNLQKKVAVLLDSNFPVELMKVYLSTDSMKKHCASVCIRQIIAASLSTKPSNAYFYPLILEFGKMLRCSVGYDNELYLFCRDALAQLVHDHINLMAVIDSLRDIIPFVRQIGEKISADLGSGLQSHESGPSVDDVRDFSGFFELMNHLIIVHSKCGHYTLKPILDGGTTRDDVNEVKTYLYALYVELLKKIGWGLQIMENAVTQSGKEALVIRKRWRQYFPILKVLYRISKLYSGADVYYRTILGYGKAAFSHLVLTYSNRTDDPIWILELKSLLDFKTRRHLVLFLFPAVEYNYEDMNELLIDRSDLLVQSFEYIRRADRNTLHSSLYVEFKNEEAIGPGVLREWFFLVCQAIFYSGNPLFTACPNDRRRFYLNPASTVDPLYPDYLCFCGRVIALALRHNVHIGIVLDRVFFLQLSGMPVNLEDIRDADPEFYRSCKHILDMDAEFVDTDALGLTFVWEEEQMGSRNVIELCHDGKNKVVNSRNRAEYVRRLVHYRFVESTSNQLQLFANGFEDVLADPTKRYCFFQSLDLGDLDFLLQGNATDISVEDWKAHTEYNVYHETDPQIAWFWEIVGEMSAEQQRVLLFFWTSIKYLPPDGFGGLNSKLLLSKVHVSEDRLPSSRTCFLKLCLPPYSSIQVMRSRLSIIAQEHVGLSFGSY